MFTCLSNIKSRECILSYIQVSRSTQTSVRLPFKIKLAQSGNITLLYTVATNIFRILLLYRNQKKVAGLLCKQLPCLST